MIVTKFDKEAVMDVNIDQFYNRESGYIHFNYNREKRSLFYCVTLQQYTPQIEKMFDEDKNCVCLILGCWGNSAEIMTEVVSVFGGYVDENDCDDIDAIYIKQSDNFIFSEYAIEREEIIAVLDQNLSHVLKYQIATQILKHKTELKSLFVE